MPCCSNSNSTQPPKDTLESLWIVFVEWRSGHIQEALAIAIEVANTFTSENVLFGYGSFVIVVLIFTVYLIATDLW